VILLDTDAMIDVLRQFPPAIAWLWSLGDEEIALPGYVVMELLDGEPNKEAMARVQRALTPYDVYWPMADDCDRALALFSRLKLSHGLGPFDALIAETAKGLGVPLQTFNLRHDSHVPGLKAVRLYARAAHVE